MIKLLSVILLLFSFQLCAENIDVTQEISKKLINPSIHTLTDSSGLLTVSDALKEYELQKFEKNINENVNFGFTKDAVWLSLSFINNEHTSIEKTIQIHNAWLDKADVYFIRDKKIIEQLSIGDAYPFHERDLKQRVFTIRHQFAHGNTLVLVRIASEDPMVVPIFLLDKNTHDEQRVSTAYFYGFIYGTFLVLLIYTFIFSISLKNKCYLLYFFYLLSFWVFNFTYTGHGYMYLWPNNQLLQQWLPYISMFSYVFFGVMFTFEFLKTKIYLPVLYHYKSKIYVGLLVLIIATYLIFDRLHISIISLLLLSSLSVFMLIIGVYSLKNGYKTAWYIIPAVLTGAGGATLTVMTVMDLITYSNTMFHMVEICMVIEMSALAFVLGFSLKQNEKARISAELQSQEDHLTKLYNRRGFIKRVEPLWALGSNHKHPMSIILLDIDWFKSINDTYGHAVGDEVLKELANILNSSTRNGEIISRWGGEEFIIFLPNANVVIAKQTAEDIRSVVEKAIVAFEGISISVTASLGVASSHDNISIEELINSADTYLYEAKKGGRNRVCSGQE